MNNHSQDNEEKILHPLRDARHDFQKYFFHYFFSSEEGDKSTLSLVFCKITSSTTSSRGLSCGYQDGKLEHENNIARHTTKNRE